MNESDFLAEPQQQGLRFGTSFRFMQNSVFTDTISYHLLLHISYATYIRSIKNFTTESHHFWSGSFCRDGENYFYCN